MSGYNYQSGAVDLNGVTNGQTVTIDLDGFDSVDINISIDALNATYMTVQLSTGISGGGVNLGQSPRLYSGGGVTFSVDGASSGVILSFFISGGAATADITYKVVARG